MSSILSQTNDSEMRSIEAFKKLESLMAMNAETQSFTSPKQPYSKQPDSISTTLVFFNGRREDNVIDSNSNIFVLKQIACRILLRDKLNIILNGSVMKDSWIISDYLHSDHCTLHVKINENISNSNVTSVSSISQSRLSYMDQQENLPFSPPFASSSFSNPFTQTFNSNMSKSRPSSIPLKSDNQRDAVDAYSQSFQESKLDSSFPHESDASISMVSRGSILQTPRKNNVAIALQQSGAASAAGSWSSNMAQTNTTADIASSGVLSEEASYHSVLSRKKDISSSNLPCFEEVKSQLEQAMLYSHVAQTRLKLSIQKYEYSLHSQALSGKRREDLQYISKEVEDSRAERDLWCLLRDLLECDLIKDYDDDQCDMRLNDAIEACPTNSSIKHVVESLIENDARIRKARVLKDWIEGMSRDAIQELPPMRREGGSWSATLHRIQSQASGGSDREISSIHPDAQLSQDGYLKKLHPDDNAEQEALMKTIWQCVRSGDIVKAQYVAHEYNAHWLAAVLMGVSEEFYSERKSSDATMDVDGEDGGPAVTRFDKYDKRGNGRRSTWMLSGWKYVESLFGNVMNQGNNQANLEIAVFAALCNHLSVLVKSPLVTLWSDQLWAVLKASYDIQIFEGVHAFRCKRLEYSNYYNIEDEKLLATEKLFLQKTHRMKTFCRNNFSEMFAAIPPVFSPSSSQVSQVLLELQKAIIEGYSSLRYFITHTMVAFSTEGGMSQERCRVLRLFAHVVLWLYFACEEHSYLRDLVPDTVLFSILEAYIDNLIDREQFSLVALYSTFLSRPKRINKYVVLMKVATAQRVLLEGGGGSSAMPTKHLLSNQDGAAAPEIIELATRYFPEDIDEIAKAVIRDARENAGGPEATRTHGGNMEDDLVLGADDSFVAFNTPDVSSKHRARNLTSQGFGRGTAGGVHDTLQGSAVSRRSDRYNVLASPISTIKKPPRTDVFGITGNTTVHDMNFDSRVFAKTSLLQCTVPQADAERMESLKWLCYRPDQRRTAVQQANAFLRSLMIESDGTKLKQIQTLLADILPADALRAADEYQLTWNDLVLEEKGKEAADKDAVEWESEHSQMTFWLTYNQLMNDVQVWSDACARFHEELGQSLGSADIVKATLGRHKHSIEELAETCIRNVMKVLCYFPLRESADVSNVDSSYQSVWLKCEQVNVEKLSDIYSQYRADTSAAEESADSEVDSVLEPFESIQEMALKITNMQNELSSLAAANGKSSQQANSNSFSDAADFLYGYPEEFRDLDSVLILIFNRHGNTRRTFRAYSKCLETLSTVVENRKAMYLMTALILRVYVNVTSQTANVLKILDEPKSALYWHQQCVRVADIVADEREDCKYYKCVKREELKKVLNAVQQSAIEIMKINHVFEM